MALNSSGGGGSAGAVRAGRAFVELWTKNNLATGLNAAAADLKKFGRGVTNIGLKFAGLGAVGATALLPMANTLKDLAKQGAIADAIGLTTEQFTGIAGVAKSVGNDTKEFIESLVTLGKLGTDAAAGTEQASQAFASMGLNAQEFIKLRADEQFFAVFDAMNKMQDPLQRTRALMLAFGEDGGKILLPLLGKSGDELRKMAAGFAISGDDMQAATKASTAYATATQTLSKAWRELSIAAAPIVSALAAGISAAVAPFTEFVRQNREVVIGIGLAVAGVTALGVGMLALGPAITAVGAAWGVLTGIVAGSKVIFAAASTVMMAPILAIPAAATVAWLAFTGSGQSALASVAGAFDGLFTDITKGWKSVVAAISRGDLAGAFAVGVTSLKVEMQKVSNWMEELHVREKMRANRALAVLNAINRSVDYDGANGGAPAGAGSGAFEGPPTLLASGAMGLDLSLVGQGAGRASMLSAASKKALQDAKDAATAAQLGVYLRGQWSALTGGVNGGLGAFGRLFGGNNPLAAQMAGITSATRGTFGGSASSGFFGGSGSVGEKMLVELKKGNDLAEKQLNKMGGPVGAVGGGLTFVRGN